jgi:hypothetical protein
MWCEYNFRTVLMKLWIVRLYLITVSMLCVTTYSNAGNDIVSTIGFSNVIDFSKQLPNLAQKQKSSVAIWFTLYPAGSKIGSSKVWSERKTVIFNYGIGKFDFSIPVYRVSQQNKLDLDDFKQSSRQSSGLVLNILYQPDASVSKNIPLTSIPYAIRTETAATVLRGEASKVIGKFKKITINMDQLDKSSLIVLSQGGKNVFSVNKNTIGINRYPDPKYAININTSVNATAYYINGREVVTSKNNENISFLWKKEGNDLFYSSGNISVGKTRNTNSNTNNRVEVGGSVNAILYFQNGTPLLPTVPLWRITGKSNQELYTLYNVGIGEDDPKAALHVLGGIQVSTPSTQNSQSIPTGTLYLSTDKYNFIGRKNNEDQILNGKQGSGHPNKLLTITINNKLDEVQGLIVNESGNISIGNNHKTIIDTTRLSIKEDTVGVYPLFTIVTSQNKAVITVSQKGNVAIGAQNADRYGLDITGTINATNIFINNQAYRCVYSTKSNWKPYQKNKGCSELNYSISVDSPIGIGKDHTPNPESAGLELTSPESELGKTYNPEIRFTASQNISYIMGVSRADKNKFFIKEVQNNNGNETRRILLAITPSKNLGVGIITPNANLHVSGNLGLLMTSSKDCLIPRCETDVAGSPNISQFIFDSKKRSLRVGFVDGAQWSTENFQQDGAIAIGKNPVINGVGSTIFGGENNKIKRLTPGEQSTLGFDVNSGSYNGEFSFAAGKNNTVYTNRSVALGHKATVQHANVFVYSNIDSYSRRYFGEATPVFTSMRNNQFIIRAMSGVGVGTNKTETNGGVNGLTLALSIPTLNISPTVNRDSINTLAMKNYIVTNNTGNPNSFYHFNPDFRVNTRYVNELFEVVISKASINAVIDNKLANNGEGLNPRVNISAFRKIVSENVQNALSGREEGISTNWVLQKRKEMAIDIFKAVAVDTSVCIETVLSSAGNHTGTYHLPNKNISGPGICTVPQSLNTKYRDYFVDKTNNSIEKFVSDNRTETKSISGNDMVKITFFLPLIERSKFSWDRHKSNIKNQIEYQIIESLKDNNILDSSGKLTKEFYRPLPTQNTMNIADYTVVKHKLIKHYYQSLMTINDTKGVPLLRVRHPGRIQIGVTESVTPNHELSISGNVVIINNTINQSQLSDASAKLMLIYNNQNAMVVKNKNKSTPNMIINERGQVIMGGHAGLVSQNTKLRIYGSIRGKGMQTGDAAISTEDPKIYFNSNSVIKTDIFYVSGNIGIGQASPNSLVSLKGHSPSILFDSDGGDNDFLLQVNSRHPFLHIATKNSHSPIINFYKNRMGVNISSIPSATLHVTGNMVVSSMNIGMPMTVADTLLSASIANFNGAFSLGGTILVWSKDINGNIYDLNRHPCSHVGIGTDTFDLENCLTVSGNFLSSGTLSTRILKGVTRSRIPTIDIGAIGSQMKGRLYVVSRDKRVDLIFETQRYGRTRFTTINANIAEGPYLDSSPKKIVQWESDGGELIAGSLWTWKQGAENHRNSYWEWVSPNWVPTSNYVLTSNGTLTIPSGNILWEGTSQKSSPNIIISKVNINTYDEGTLFNSTINPAVVYVETQLDYLRDTVDGSYDFTVVSLNMINRRIINSNITGLDILVTKNNTDELGAVKIKSAITGLNIRLNSQNDSKAGDNVSYKTAASFTGSVGINTIPNTDETVTQPILVVNGDIKATAIKISNQLNLNAIKVMSNALVNTNDKIGIGLIPNANSNYSLEITGNINAMGITSNSLVGTSLGTIGHSRFNNLGGFNVGTEGTVRIGTQRDDTTVLIQHKLNYLYDQYPSDPNQFTFKKIEIVVSRNGLSLNSAGIRVLDISIKTATNNRNKLGSNRSTPKATGMKIDLSQLNLRSTAKAIGLSVNLPTRNENVTRHAAIFRGGPVGIGTGVSIPPSYNLYVNGAIKASDVYSSDSSSLGSSDTMIQYQKSDGSYIDGVFDSLKINNVRMTNLRVKTLNVGTLYTDRFIHTLLRIESTSMAYKKSQQDQLSLYLTAAKTEITSAATTQLQTLSSLFYNTINNQKAVIEGILSQITALSPPNLLSKTSSPTLDQVQTDVNTIIASINNSVLGISAVPGLSRWFKDLDILNINKSAFQNIENNRSEAKAAIRANLNTAIAGATNNIIVAAGAVTNDMTTRINAVKDEINTITLAFITSVDTAANVANATTTNVMAAVNIKTAEIQALSGTNYNNNLLGAILNARLKLAANTPGETAETMKQSAVEIVASVRGNIPFYINPFSYGSPYSDALKIAVSTRINRAVNAYKDSLSETSISSISNMITSGNNVALNIVASVNVSAFTPHFSDIYSEVQNVVMASLEGLVGRDYDKYCHQKYGSTYVSPNYCAVKKVFIPSINSYFTSAKGLGDFIPSINEKVSGSTYITQLNTEIQVTKNIVDAATLAINNRSSLLTTLQLAVEYAFNHGHTADHASLTSVYTTAKSDAAALSEDPPSLSDPSTIFLKANTLYSNLTTFETTVGDTLSNINKSYSPFKASLPIEKAKNSILSALNSAKATLISLKDNEFTLSVGDLTATDVSVSANLNVIQDAIISERVSVNTLRVVNVNSLAGTDIQLKPSINIQNGLTVQSGLYLLPQLTLQNTSTITVNSSVSVNLNLLKEPYSKVSQNHLFKIKGNNQKPEMIPVWVNNNLANSIVTINIVTISGNFRVNGVVDTTSPGTSLSSIVMRFKDRKFNTDVISTNFNGLLVKMKGEAKNSTGLKVDIASLNLVNTIQSDQGLPETTTAKSYAAIFKGGPVGISTTQNSVVQAHLHIYNTTANLTTLKINDKNGTVFLEVSENVHINKVLNVGGNLLIEGRPIIAEIAATTINVTTINVTTVNVNSLYIGEKKTTVTGSVRIEDTINARDTSEEIGLDIKMVVNKERNLGGNNVYGLRIVSSLPDIESDPSSFMADSLIGLYVNIEDIVMTRNMIVESGGLPEAFITGNKFAAVFRGGEKSNRLGIGAIIPSAPLHVFSKSPTLDSIVSFKIAGDSTTSPVTPTLSLGLFSAESKGAKELAELISAEATGWKNNKIALFLSSGATNLINAANAVIAEPNKDNTKTLVTAAKALKSLGNNTHPQNSHPTPPWLHRILDTMVANARSANNVVGRKPLVTGIKITTGNNTYSSYPLVITSQNNKVAVGIGFGIPSGEIFGHPERLTVSGNVWFTKSSKLYFSGASTRDKNKFSMEFNTTMDETQPTFLFKLKESTGTKDGANIRFSIKNNISENILTVMKKNEIKYTSNRKERGFVVIGEFDKNNGVPPIYNNAPLHIRGAHGGSSEDDLKEVTKNYTVAMVVSGNGIVGNNILYLSSEMEDHPIPPKLPTDRTVGIDDFHYMTFLSGSNASQDKQHVRGVIEAWKVSVNATIKKTLSFTSGGHDYAEYMRKRDPLESIKSGDVVGVFGGEISKETHGADWVMAVSGTPIIVGNFRGDEQQNSSAIVGFLGQVAVNVMGPVKEGDLLIPSGKNNGIAIAISPILISSRMINSVIGRSLETHDASQLKQVNTLIGSNSIGIVLDTQINDLKHRIQVLKKQNKINRETINYYVRKRNQQQSVLKKHMRKGP